MAGAIDPIDITDWEQTGPRRGTRPGGVHETPAGDKWYVKSPASNRQGHNEVLASALYREMGFNAVTVYPTTDGRVASEWIDSLPESTQPTTLASRDEALEAFLPSAWIANWDVIGLEYDNMLPDPNDSNGVVLLDFGGSFDTRAMGGSKQFGPRQILAFDGFLDRSINPTAPTIFENVESSHYTASKERVRRLDESSVRAHVEAAMPQSAVESRISTLMSRRDVILDTPYEQVFGP